MCLMYMCKIFSYINYNLLYSILNERKLVLISKSYPAVLNIKHLKQPIVNLLQGYVYFYIPPILCMKIQLISIQFCIYIYHHYFKLIFT